MRALHISVTPVEDRRGNERGVLLRFAHLKGRAWLHSWLARHPLTAAQIILFISLFKKQMICRVSSAPVFISGSRDQMAQVIAAMRSLSGPVRVELVREPALLDEPRGWYDVLG